MTLFRYKNKHEKNVSRKRFIRTCSEGDVIDLSKVSDPAVASKILGEGFGVVCTSKEIKAPVSGIIKDVSDEGHSYAITSPDGVELLVFITGKGESDRIEPKVCEGQEVKAGDLLCVKENAEVSVIVTNVEIFSKYRIALGKAKSSSDGVIVYEI